MAYEIINTRKGSSTIRVVGPDTVTATLSSLSTNTQLEVVNSANIKRILWSTAPTGNVNIARGATPNTIFNLYGSGEIRLDEWGAPGSNGATGNIVITVAVGGTCIIDVTKDVTYTTNLDIF